MHSTPDAISAYGRLRRVVPQSKPAVIATGLALLQYCVLSFLVHRQISGAGTNSWDLGIFNQAVWAMAHGEAFMTYRGMDVYGHHFHPVFFALAPLSWLGGGARALSLLQVGALCLGSWPAFLLGRDRMSRNHEKTPWFGLLFASIYLLHPMVTGLSWWMFHPESLAVAAILGAWWAACERRWKLYLGLVIWIMFCREDIALAMAGFGLTLAIVQRADRRSRRIGVATMLTAVSYWGVVTQVVMPERLGTREPYYVKDFWGHLGSTMPEVVTTALKHPDRALAGVRGTDGAAFAATLLGPTGGTAIFSPFSLIGTGPQLFAVTLSSDPDSRQPWHHHTTVVMPFMIVASVETLRRLHSRRPKLIKPVVSWMVISASLSYFVMAPTPIGPLAGRWTSRTAQSDIMHEAAALVPPDAAVVATITPGNLITNRAVAYTWPNPYKKWKRGYETRDLPSPDTVDYLLVLRSELGNQQPMFDRLIAPGGDYTVLLDDSGVVLAQRR